MQTQSRKQPSEKWVEKHEERLSRIGQSQRNDSGELMSILDKEKEEEERAKMLAQQSGQDWKKPGNSASRRIGVFVGPADAAIDGLLIIFAARIGFTMKDSSRWREAVTFPSYHGGRMAHNGRLASLGRRLTDQIAAEHLFQTYPNMPAGMMERTLQMFTNENTLGAVSRDIGLLDLIRYMRPAKATADDAAILLGPIAVTSLVAAVQLDHGMDAARVFLRKHVLSRELRMAEMVDPATAPQDLQSLLRSLNKAGPVVFKVINETGRYTHAAEYTVGAYVSDKLIGKGTASSMQKAGQAAAQKILVEYYSRPDPQTSTVAEL